MLKTIINCILEGLQREAVGMHAVPFEHVASTTMNI